MRKFLFSLFVVLVASGGGFCLWLSVWTSHGGLPCVFLAVVLVLWIAVIAGWSKGTFSKPDPSGVFKSILLLSAWMGVSVVFPNVYNLLHDPGISAFYALAAAFLIADFAGILFLVANALRAIASRRSGDEKDATPEHAAGTEGKHLSTKELDDLKALVLYMGLAAGAAVGILVGIDGYRRAMGHLGEERVYTLILDSFGLAAAAGILIAVFVAVGMLVFVFEHKVRGFTEHASDLVEQIHALSLKVEDLNERMDRSSQDVVLATAALKLVGPQILTSSFDLSILANTLLDVPRIRQSRLVLPVTPEAYYLRSWISQMPDLNDAGAECVAEVVRAIAASYWIEETSDISRFELVTNSRNYTAFLIAAVTVLKEAAQKTSRKVHFYTSTPVGPRSLLDWPMRDYSGQQELHYHGDKDFISSYMLFIRDIVKNDKDVIFHRRWIWTDADKRRGDFERFSSWPHYERKPIDETEFFNNSTCVLGVPVRACESIKALVEKTLQCGKHSVPQNDVWDEWYDRVGANTYVYPLLAVGGAFQSSISDSVVAAKSSACKAVIGKLPLLLFAAKALADKKSDSSATLLRDEEITFISEISEAVTKFATENSATIELPRMGLILMAMQKLDAALHLGRSQLSDASDVKAAILEVEAGLRWLKWWQLWQVDYPGSSGLPLFKDYFGSAFQSDGKPHSVDVKDLAGALKDCKVTGPEFALLGLETEEAPDIVLDQQTGIKWLVAFKSSISEPWDSGTISVVLRSDARFQSYVEAMKSLCKISGLTAYKEDAQGA